jgi:hypothetical protein
MSNDRKVAKPGDLLHPSRSLRARLQHHIDTGRCKRGEHNIHTTLGSSIACAGRVLLRCAGRDLCAGWRDGRRVCWPGIPSGMSTVRVAGHSLSHDAQYSAGSSEG